MVARSLAILVRPVPSAVHRRGRGSGSGGHSRRRVQASSHPTGPGVDHVGHLGVNANGFDDSGEQAEVTIDLDRDVPSKSRDVVSGREVTWQKSGQYCKATITLDSEDAAMITLVRQSVWSLARSILATKRVT